MRLLPIFFALLAGCSLLSTWHWEKRGATADDLEADTTFCKLRTYSGTDGMVTQSSVRAMQGCMQGRGWSRVAN